MYDQAKIKAIELFNKGENVPYVYEQLQQLAEEDERPRNVRVVYNWYEKYTQQAGNYLKTFLPSAVSNRQRDNDQSIEELYRAFMGLPHSAPVKLGSDIKKFVKDQLVPLKPPSLQDLIKSGLEKQVAIRLLKDWDMAVIDGHASITRELKQTVKVLAEDPDIPYKWARRLAGLEMEQGTSPSFLHRFGSTLASMIRRYRPWEGPENEKAYEEVYLYWVGKELPRVLEDLEEYRAGELEKILQEKKTG